MLRPISTVPGSRTYWPPPKRARPYIAATDIMAALFDNRVFLARIAALGNISLDAGNCVMNALDKLILKGVFDSGDCPETWTAVREQLGVQFSVEAIEQRARQLIVRVMALADNVTEEQLKALEDEFLDPLYCDCVG